MIKKTGSPPLWVSTVDFLEALPLNTISASAFSLERRLFLLSIAIYADNRELTEDASLIGQIEGWCLTSIEHACRPSRSDNA